MGTPIEKSGEFGGHPNMGNTEPIPNGKCVTTREESRRVQEHSKDRKPRTGYDIV